MRAYDQAMWMLKLVRELYDEARTLPLDRATRERVDRLGLEIAGYIGSSIAWLEPEASARMKATAIGIERDLRDLVSGLPPSGRI
jgi:hypothetical protein